jgi:hypothetical protein
VGEAGKFTGFQAKSLNGKRPTVTVRLWEGNIKMNQEIVWEGWSGFVWLIIWRSDVFL